MFYLHFSLSTGCSQCLDKPILQCFGQFRLTCPKQQVFFAFSSAKSLCFLSSCCAYCLWEVSAHTWGKYTKQSAFNCFWNSTENCLDQIYFSDLRLETELTSARTTKSTQLRLLTSLRKLFRNEPSSLPSAVVITVNPHLLLTSAGCLQTAVLIRMGPQSPKNVKHVSKSTRL